MAANQEIVQAYRNLYKGLLKAVQYTNPMRFVARDTLRDAFRERGATFDPEGVKRTVWFLQAAAKERGLEHRILKNMLRVRINRLGTKSWRLRKHALRKQSPVEEDKKTAYRHYDMTVAMLNKTMGLCLR